MQSRLAYSRSFKAPLKGSAIYAQLGIMWVTNLTFCILYLVETDVVRLLVITVYGCSYANVCMPCIKLYCMA